MATVPTLALLALLRPAAAHLPHAVVSQVLPAPGLDPREPWFAIVQARPAVLARSDDGGVDWTMVAAAPAGDEIRAAARDATGRLFVASRQFLWWTDDGEVWSRVDLPTEVSSVVTVGDSVFLAGSNGIYAFDGGEVVGPVFAGRTTRLVGGARPVALLADGRFVRLEGSEWVAREAPLGASAAVDDGERAVVGTRDGRAWRLEGDNWVPCGDFPLPGGDHPDVVALATDGSVLALATGEHAGFTSVDGCDTWRDDTAPLTMLYGAADGLLQDPDDAVQSLHVAGDRLAWCGFDGIWTLPGLGRAWREGSVLGGDYTRGAAWLGRGDELALVLGFYAAGPSRTDDGGDAWAPGNAGLADTNTQAVVADAHTGQMLAVVGHTNWASDDGGGSWTALPTTLDMESFVAFDPTTPGRALAAQVGGGAAESFDGGATWHPLEVGEWGGAPGAHAALPSGLECLGFEAPAGVLCRDMAHPEWTSATDLAPSSQVRLAANARVILVATDDTLWRLRAADGPLDPLVVLAADRFATLGWADDATLLAATRAGDLWLSRDDGDAWVTYSGALGAPAHTLLPLPGFATRAEVVLPTLDGVYLWREATGASEPLAPVERLDLSSPFWDTPGCPAELAHDGAHHGAVLPVDAGCLATTQLHGERLRLYGTSSGAGRVSVLVDGEEVAVVGEAVATDLQLLLSLELAPGLHQVTLAGVEPGVTVDVVEGRWTGVAWSPGEADTGAELVPAVDAGAERACGCEGSAVLLVPTVLARRRRRSLLC